MTSVRRTAAIGTAGALAAGIAVTGLGAADAATYPPITPTPTVTVTVTPSVSPTTPTATPTTPTPTPTPTNPGTFKCTAKAVGGKDRIRVRLTAKGAAADYKDYVFKIQKYLRGQRAWRVNNIVYAIDVNKPRTVDREAGRYRAKCFGPTNLATYTKRVKLTR